MISLDYLYTSVHSKIDDLQLSPKSTYLYSHDIEERSKAVDNLIAQNPPEVSFIEVSKGSSDRDEIIINSTGKKYQLRSSASMMNFFNDYEAETIYLDITGIDKRVIAGLLNSSINALNDSASTVKEVRTIYAEPREYKIKQFQLEGMFYDLSEKIDGINPLPGFASIFPDDSEDITFVAFLGFEGGRFTYVLEHLQIPDDNVIPVVGVPGFRIEYPFFAYWGNRTPLSNTQSWRRTQFATANSLVDAYTLLEKIQKKDPTKKIKLAPIGTKPHLLAAILFAIKFPKQVELVYDNPKRKQVRTDGIGNIVECSVSKLLFET